MRVDVDANGQPVHIRPDQQHPISHGYACAKGTRFLEVARHPDRLLHPVRHKAAGQYGGYPGLKL